MYIYILYIYQISQFSDWYDFLSSRYYMSNSLGRNFVIEFISMCSTQCCMYGWLPYNFTFYINFAYSDDMLFERNAAQCYKIKI